MYTQMKIAIANPEPKDNAWNDKEIVQLHCVPIGKIKYSHENWLDFVSAKIHCCDTTIQEWSHEIWNKINFVKITSLYIPLSSNKQVECKSHRDHRIE